MKEGKDRKRIWRRIFSLFIILFFIILLVLYWFLPNIPFDLNFDTNTNFSTNNDTTGMQFYTNMRFPSEKISYSIDEDCGIKKKEDMKWAFNILEEQTVLDFYESSSPQIRVSCNEKSKIDESGLFIAGEGGPVNISMGKYFRVIQGGQILLIRDSKCERPNVAIHELLHVLGFDHSDNPNNIMYPISKCKQIIGEDTIQRINELYETPSLPDLEFEKVSATMKSRFLNVEIIIKNEGLKESGNFKVGIFTGENKIKEIELEGIPIGYGHSIKMENIIVPQIKINDFNFKIDYRSEEINKKNNEITLNITK
jgi:hypothetical protein